MSLHVASGGGGGGRGGEGGGGGGGARLSRLPLDPPLAKILQGRNSEGGRTQTATLTNCLIIAGVYFLSPRSHE